MPLYFIPAGTSRSVSKSGQHRLSYSRLARRWLLHRWLWQGLGMTGKGLVAVPGIEKKSAGLAIFMTWASIFKELSRSHPNSWRSMLVIVVPSPEWEAYNLKPLSPDHRTLPNPWPYILGWYMSGSNRYSWVLSAYWWHQSPKLRTSWASGHIQMLNSIGEEIAI